jgi:hypothetical protein
MIPSQGVDREALTREMLSPSFPPDLHVIGD